MHRSCDLALLVAVSHRVPFRIIHCYMGVVHFFLRGRTQSVDFIDFGS